MKRSSVPRLIAILLLLSLSMGEGVSQNVTEYVPNQIIIKLRAAVSPGDRASLRNDLGATVIRRFSLIDAELWDITGLSLTDAMARLADDPRIEYIEPNYIVHATDIFPNDPEFERLWGLHNTGQTGGTPDADIDAPEAWQIETGDTVLVGVIDSGVDWTHVDLAANMWVNPGEIPGNGIDDDGNGYVDDVRGWDFVNDDNDPMDDHAHGTHVSGTIAAIGDNGIGVVGVSWSARIMPLKFLNSSGSGSTGNAILAVEYATRMGARLTNNSWGGAGFSSALRDAIVESGNAGMLFIAAAGNSGQDADVLPHYPAAYDLNNIISVAWTNNNDELAPNSNYGAVSVDLGAPGHGILSTFPNDSYGYFNGTSMAAPHVSGVVSLMWADSPQLSHLEVKDVILTTVDIVPDLDGRTVTGGRLNAYQALEALVDSIPPAAVMDLATTAPTSNSITLTWTATGEDSASGTAESYDIRYSLLPIDDANFDLATETLGEPPPGPPGSSETFIVDGLDFNTTYYFAMTVSDKRENVSSVSNSPSGTTLGPPIVSVDPSSFEESLLTGGTSSRSLTVRNIGEGTLDFDFAALPWVAAVPPSGRVWAGESTEVSVVFDATGLSGGDHTDTLILSSNDPLNPALPIAVLLHVTAAPDIAVSESALDFGSAWLDLTERDTLAVSNVGSDDLVVSQVVVDHPEFGADAGGFVLVPGETFDLEVTFTPVTEGLKEGTLTIISDDPFEPEVLVSLRGVGGTAPFIVVHPEEMSASLMTGETSTQILTIENIGGSDLNYTILEGTTANPALSYRVVSSRSGDRSVEDRRPITSHIGPATATEIELRSLLEFVELGLASGRAPSSMTRAQRNRYATGPVPASAEQIGVLLLHSNVDIGAMQAVLSTYPDFSRVDALDARFVVPPLETLLDYECVIVSVNVAFEDPVATGDLLADYVDAGGAVVLTEGAFTNHPPNDFSVHGRFRDEGYMPFESGPVDFSSVLGTFDSHHPIMNCVDEIISGTVTGVTLAPGATWVADYESGVPAVATKDRVAAVNVFLFTSWWGEGVPDVVRNAALWSTDVRQWNCWASACPDFATILPGGMLHLEVTFDAGARCVAGGEYSDTLIVASNAPNQPEVRVALNLSVTPLPDIVVSHVAFDFGPVFVGATEEDTLTITNEGAADLTISGITIDNADFDTETSGFVLSPFESRSVEVRFAPSSQGLKEGTLTISSDDPETPEVSVLLSGKGLIAPVVNVFPESLGDSLQAGETSTHTLTIENNGNGDLFFSVFESEAGLSILGVENTALEKGPDDLEVVGSVRDLEDRGQSRQPYVLNEISNLVSARFGNGGVGRSDPLVVSGPGKGLERNATGERRRVLLLVSGLDMTALRGMLSGFDDIDVVDEIQGEFVLPTLETVLDYHCVIVIVNRPFTDPVGVGDLLADYVDRGGSVILSQGAFLQVFGSDYSIHGRFMDEGYSPFTVANWFFGVGTMGDFDESHPIMLGVEEATTNVLSTSILTPGAEWVASFTNGHGFIGTKGAVSVGVNAFLDTSVPSWTGDIPLILRNAILWGTGERLSWVSPTPINGYVPPHSAAEVTILFDASSVGQEGGHFSDMLVVRSNDPADQRVIVPIDLHVWGRRTITLPTQWSLVSWNVNTDDDATPHILSDIMGDLNVALGFDEGGLTYDPSIPPEFNTLNTMDHMHGYWLGMNAASELIVEGYPVGADTPIPLSAGWNLVSYLPNAADSTAHAIGSVIDNTVVVLGYEDGGLMFDPNIPPEFNTLNIMKPNHGYWIKTTADGVLVYPETSVHPGGMLPSAPSVVSAGNRALVDGVPEVIRTREWIGIWGDDVLVGGELLPEGTLVKAVDAQGVVCGCWIVGLAGKLGLMAVYKDDPNTEIDEGPLAGDTIDLFAGEVKIASAITWTGMGDIIHYNDAVTAIGDKEQTLPSHFAIEQNYPNPFNPVTTIRYALPKDARAHIVIFNIRGQVVRELVGKWQPAGRYTVTWDGTSAAGNPVASGVYFYRFKAGDFVETKKLVLLK